MGSVEERQPSLSKEDLTPIVLSKLREESLRKTESPNGGLKKDRGTAAALMSAISASFQDLTDLGKEEGGPENSGLAPELVVEVNSVLSKLMNSLNKNFDPELIPTIKDLQACLNSKTKPSSALKSKDELVSEFRSSGEPSEECYSASKVPWKIRAARKRAVKHHTTGMTKDEFDQIKKSLYESAKTFTSIPAQSYALARNKSESAIRRNHDSSSQGLDLTPKPIETDTNMPQSYQQVDGNRAYPSSSKTTDSLFKPSDLGYASDVCDYNVVQNGPKVISMNKGTDEERRFSKDENEEPVSRISTAKAEDKPPRRNSKSSGSAVKARIARRKRMRHANVIDNPQGSLSDQESSMIEDDEEEDSIEEKQDKEQIDEKRQLFNKSQSGNELTPEMGRRKNWNSRFSNIKSTFASEEEISSKSRSPSINNERTKDDKNKMNSNIVSGRSDDKYMNLVVQARLENSQSKMKFDNNNNLSSDNKFKSSKSKQPTPSRDPPKSPPRLSKSLPRESRAEIVGIEPTNKNNKNDMDYQEYMNIINRVRRTKESTRVRIEQFRLASMYAQEKRRQEELKREEELLKLEREKVQRDLERQQAQQPARVPSPEELTTEKLEQTPSPQPLVQEKSEQEEVSLEKSEEELRFEKMRQEQKRQQELREEQVRTEQEKLERLRQEQIRQEKEREEIRRLESERLQQIQEEQRELDEERRRQQERIRLEQIRLEEERKRQETLQAEKNAEYNRQRLNMEAQNVYLPQETRAKLLMSPPIQENPPVAQASSSDVVSMSENLSPEEKIIQKRLADQENLRKAHKAEESKIRQEKLKLIQQEEMLISRQEEMLRQVESERQNLLMQEQLIRSRQQGRLQQVRQEKMLLEKQEEMLLMRERQLMQERARQDKLRTEQKSLREQEEVIRKRQEQISKELMGDITLCEAREGRVFKPKSVMVYPEIIPSLSDIKQSTEEIPRDEENNEETEDEDTLDEEEEEFYESKVEVKQNPTSIPTSVRTIEMASDNKPWAPVTPYLSTYGSKPTNEEEEIFLDDEKAFVKSGIITSPESLRTSATLITTPDESSLQLSLDGSNTTTPPPVPPLPMDDVFRPVQPDVPPRVSSYEVVASSAVGVIKEPPRRSLIDNCIVTSSSVAIGNCQLSPQIGGPGSAFKPYSSSENLHDPLLFPAMMNGIGNGSTVLLPPTYPAAKKTVVHNKVKELRKPIRAPFSTTDTEPEMKECHLPSEKSRRPGQKQHPLKPSYSTSETEDEAYLSRRTKWSKSYNQNHQKSLSSWDPFQVDSPPQITQKPVGIIQKPKPQHQQPLTVTLGVVESPIPAATVSHSFFPSLVIERGAQINEFIPNRPIFVQSNHKEMEPKLDIPLAVISPQAVIIHNGAQYSQIVSSEASDFPHAFIPPPLPAEERRTGPERLNISSKSSTLNDDPSSINFLAASNFRSRNIENVEKSAPHNQLSLPKQFPNEISRARSFTEAQKMYNGENQEPHKIQRQNSSNPVLVREKGPSFDSIQDSLLSDEKGFKIQKQASFPGFPIKENGYSNEPLKSFYNPTQNKSQIPLNSKNYVPASSNSKPSESDNPKTENKPKEIVNENKVEQSSSMVPLSVAEINSKRTDNVEGKEDETRYVQDMKKKKALHQKLVNEAVSFRKDHHDGKKKLPVSRTNPTIAAMEIMTRKEIKTCEMEERFARENYQQQQAQKNSGHTENLTKSSDKLKSPTKPLKPSAKNEDLVEQTPTIILKKEPKRLNPEELKARKNSVGKSQILNSAEKKEARTINASTVITRANNGVVEKKKEVYIENLSKSSSMDDFDESRSSKIKREKVKKAAERFENAGSPVERSKSSCSGDKNKLPWTDDSGSSSRQMKPGVLRRRDTLKKNGYALRMSKSSDSITAAKALANGGLRINQPCGQDLSKSIERQLDVYTRTREEIRKILTIAKKSSVSDRIKIFNNQILGEKSSDETDDRGRKAEAIKNEILEAKAAAAAMADDSEKIRFQSPVESKVKPLKIPMKSKISDGRLRINQPPGSEAAKQKMGRKFSDSRLNGGLPHGEFFENKPVKKEPKLIMDLKSHKIYAQSATDYSAAEEEEDSKALKGKSSMQYLQVPDKKYGLKKSKSFGAPGQYECALSDEEIDEKTRQVMAFFDTTKGCDQMNKVRVNEDKQQPLKSSLKKRQRSITEEILGEDGDLNNVDDMFEKLLMQNALEVGESRGGVPSALSQSVSSSSIRTSILSGSSKSSSIVLSDEASMKKQFSDPVAALPTSHTKRYLPRQQTWAGPECPSSSPTQSGVSTTKDAGKKPKSPFAKFKQMEKQAGIAQSSIPNKLVTSPPPPVNSSMDKSPTTKKMFISRSASSAKEVILSWVRETVSDYKNIDVTNFSSSWNDGLAFCAIIHHFYPEAFDYNSLKSENRLHNFTLAFSAAEEYAGIYPLLDVDDMVKMKIPDWKCVFTYVQSFYRRFRNGRDPPPANRSLIIDPTTPPSSPDVRDTPTRTLVLLQDADKHKFRPPFFPGHQKPLIRQSTLPAFLTPPITPPFSTSSEGSI